jgi:hypothetical protein
VYEIIGTDRRYGMKQSYGRFRTLKDCLTYMESLKRSFGNIIKFRYEEVMTYERHNFKQSLCG